MTLLCIQGYFNFKINLQVLDNKNILFLKIWLQIKFAEYFFFFLEQRIISILLGNTILELFNLSQTLNETFKDKYF